MALYVRPTLGQTIDSGSVTVGKYTKVVAVTAAFENTGSNAGGSAIIRGANAVGSASLAQGDDLINLADLTAGVVYELQPQSITSVSAGKVYVLYGASR